LQRNLHGTPSSGISDSSTEFEIAYLFERIDDGDSIERCCHGRDIGTSMFVRDNPRESIKVHQKCSHSSYSVSIILDDNVELSVGEKSGRNYLQ
jgi:hypothetical protein